MVETSVMKWKGGEEESAFSLSQLKILFMKLNNVIQIDNQKSETKFGERMGRLVNSSFFNPNKVKSSSVPVKSKSQFRFADRTNQM